MLKFFPTARARFQQYSQTTIMRRHITILSLLLCRLLQAAEPADLSATHYALQGELSSSHSAGSNAPFTQKLRCEIQRSGDWVQITTSPYGSNYPATTYTCDNTIAFTFVQHRAVGSNQSGPTSAAWNNASVFVSSQRMPAYVMGRLSPLWLMVQGHTEYTRRTMNPWVSVFGSLGTQLHDQLVAVPEFSAAPWWEPGFARYNETTDVPDFPPSDRAVTQEGSFEILTWTNRTGIKFPGSFHASVKRSPKTQTLPAPLLSETSFDFVTTRISPAPNTLPSMRAPTFSAVSDTRPFESGTSESGVYYRSPEGLIYADPLAEREKGLHLSPVRVNPVKLAGPKAGTLAPGFTLKTLDGKNIALADLRGKYVLLDFWATWCGPCLGEIPELKAAYDAFGKDDRFAMLGLSLDSDPDHLARFLKEKSITWPQSILSDAPARGIAKAYGVGAIPATFLIGPDGKVISCNLRGPSIKEAVASALARPLNE